MCIRDSDISGVFLPVEADMSQAGVTEQQAPPDTTQDKQGAAPGAKAPAAASKAAAPKDEGPKKLEKVFWGDHSLTLLTFVTNNSMSRYWSVKLAQTTQAQPRMARVIYTLVPEKNKKDSFVSFASRRLNKSFLSAGSFSTVKDRARAVT